MPIKEEGEARLDEICRKLSPRKLRYLTARIECESDTDYEAAEMSGLHPSTVSKWSDKALIDEALLLARFDGVIVAKARARVMLSAALNVYEDEMKNRRGHPQRLAAADRVVKISGLEPPTRSESTSTVEHKGKVTLVLDRPYGSTIDANLAGAASESGEGSS